MGCVVKAIELQGRQESIWRRAVFFSTFHTAFSILGDILNYTARLLVGYHRGILKTH